MSPSPNEPPMDPTAQLALMRDKHGVSEIFARRFLPLIERAIKAAPEVRDRIFDLVERSFARHASKAQREAEQEPVAGFSAEALAVLNKVAKILHRWQPAPWLHGWRGER